MAGDIRGITIEFRGDATPLQKAIRTVETSLHNTHEELKKIDKALKFNPGSVELWRQKQDLLKSKIDETKDKLDALKQAQKQMDASGVDKNSAEYRKLQRDIIETESKLKSFNAQLRAIGNVQLRALGEQFKQVGQKAMQAGKSMSMYVTAPLAAIGTAAAKNFAEVDKIMVLTNETMANTAEQADLLNNAMKDAAANSTYGMNDAANATLNFARAGLTAEQAAATLAPAMNLAAGEGGNLDTVSGGLVATINGFGDSFDEASRYADVFANACNNSALDIDSLSESMSVAAPIFKAAGYQVEDAALYMGVMANAGISADKAANALKTGMARLVSPSKDAQGWMDKLGISIVNADGSMKDTIQVQAELNAAFSSLSESEQIAAASAIFGKNQMSNWLALINTAPGDVNALAKSLQNEGTTAEMAEAMMSGFGGSLESLKSSIDVAKYSLGEALAPVILKVSNGIAKLVDWFNALSPQMRTIIATVGMVVAAIGPVLVIGGALISTVGNILIGAGKLIGILTSLSPVTLAIAAVIGVLVAAGVALYKNWDEVKAYAAKLWTGLKNTFNSIKTTITSVWNAIKTATSNAWNGIKNAIMTPINAVKSLLSSAITSYRNMLVNQSNAIKNAVSTVWNGIKNAITTPINKAKELITNAINKIKSIVGGVKLQLPKFKLPHFKVSGGKAPWGIGGKGSLPSFSVDWYAKGGIFDSPTLIGIGEKGAEAVVPLDKLWNKLDNMQGGSNDTITINVYASDGMDVNALARKIEQILVNQNKQRNKAYGTI